MFLLYKLKKTFRFEILWLTDVEEVIDLAKRKLEKERELYMSKSLPGFAGDNNQGANDNDNENENENDNEHEHEHDDDSEEEDSDGSEEKGKFCNITKHCAY